MKKMAEQTMAVSARSKNQARAQVSKRRREHTPRGNRKGEIIINPRRLSKAELYAANSYNRWGKVRIKLASGGGVHGRGAFAGG